MVTKDFNTDDNKQWAVILGGSSGLGYASAEKLARHGMNLCIVHRDRRSRLAEIEEKFETLKSFGSELMTFNADALKPETIQQVIDSLNEQNGKVSVLIHSLAKGNLKPIYSEDAEEKKLTTTDFMITLEAMTVSLYSWASAFLPAGSQGTEGKLFSRPARIIAFTSEGSSKPAPNYAAVSVAKAGLEALVRSLAFELAPLEITANCIQAGVTDTESLQLIPGSDVLKDQALARNPNKRLTTPNDVANAVYLLCRPESHWITGTVIKADGGESLR
ncbi:MAG: SDR family oxidoreductase [Leeuwenhoekiella sp.]